MSHRYRLTPTPEQEVVLREHCTHARFVWNLAVEQQSWWRPGRKSAPGWAEQSRQLTEARAEFEWLRAGSAEVQGRALNDFAQAMRNFFGGACRRPTWRKADQNEGFGVHELGRHYHIKRLSRHVGAVQVPKVGWVRFRWSRTVPDGARGRYRVTMDRIGRWHVSCTEASPAGARDDLRQPVQAPREPPILLDHRHRGGRRAGLPGLRGNRLRLMLWVRPPGTRGFVPGPCGYRGCPDRERRHRGWVRCGR